MEDEVVQDANMQYAWQLLDQAGSLSLDLARSVLTSYVTTAAKTNATGRQRLAGGYIQCPHCNTPRISNLVQIRLLGRPHCLHTLRKSIRKEMKRPDKLTSGEKRLISAFRRRENRVEVTCLVCRHKMQESFTVPEREKMAVSKVVTKKKKKKKSVKEVNAGLFLPSRGQDSSSDADCRMPSSSEVPPVNIFEQSSLVKKKTKPPKKTFEKIPKEAQTLSKISDFEKSLSKRVKNSLPGSSRLGNTVSAKNQHSVIQNLHSIGLQAQNSIKADSLSFKTKQAERKQLSGLKNVMTKEVAKKSGEQQKSSLGDFLSSLF